MGEATDLAAGDFASWVTGMRAAIRGERESVVPCGGCTACCTSGQFVHVEPDEADALAHIPAALLFPAPGLPDGHVLLGYDERGHCPMLVDGACSIYAHRPRACRTYDCRVFAAAGVEPGGAIGERARRWRFRFPTREDRQRYEAVRAAAASPAAGRPANATEHAVQAVERHDRFLPRP
jgi:Fe-S-cluster containining protein